MRHFILILTIFASFILIANPSIATGSATLGYEVLDSSIRPGGETTVFLTLTNPSTTSSASNIKISISPGPYITPSTNYIEIGKLDISSSQQTSLTVKASNNAVSTISYIKVRLGYYVGTTQYESDINVPITIKRIPILQVSETKYVPSVVEPGNKIAVNFNLRNDGDGSAKDVRIILNQSAGKFIVKSSPEVFVDSINAKEFAPVSFDVVVDPSIGIGTHTIPVTLIYMDEIRNTNYTSTKYLGLTVSGKYNFIITHTQAPVAPGKNGKVDIEVANAGTQEALYLTLRVLDSYPIIHVSPSSRYMGNLKSDDYSYEDFTFKIDGTTKPGTYPLNAQVNYMDPYGQNYNETFQIDIVVSSLKDYAKSTGDGLSKFNIIITILVVGAVAYIVYRKMRKKKK